LWIVEGTDMKKWIRIRKRRGLTQFELSAKCGVPRWRIAYAEVGYLKLKPEEMKAIRRALTVEQAGALAAA
jgi:predicted transcriptional regulator